MLKRKSDFRLLCLLVIFVLLQPLSALSQKVKIDVMFYNVENLFDTIDDPMTNDEEFLPEGRYGWNSERYFEKLDRLGQVISGDGKSALPAIVGLCEVENRLVLEELTGSDRLRGAGYSIVHYDSPDARGIDVALLYKPGYFRVLQSAPLRVTLDHDPDFLTRDILFVQGITGRDTLHLYVNHWPSRRGGVDDSEPKRLKAAQVLRNHIDSVAATFLNCHVIIMGDLNDEPQDRSVSEVLMAMSPGTPCDDRSEACLYNLSATIPEGEGTYYFWRDKKWNVLDHIIVSSSLMEERTGILLKEESFRVMREPWMLKEEDGSMIPFRSYTREYEGGYSDHLPVLISLMITPDDTAKKRGKRIRKKKPKQKKHIGIEF